MKRTINLEMKKYLTLFIFILIVSTVSAANYPKLTDFVTDNANIIDSNYETRIIY